MIVTPLLLQILVFGSQDFVKIDHLLQRLSTHPMKTSNIYTPTVSAGNGQSWYTFLTKTLGNS